MDDAGRSGSAARSDSGAGRERRSPAGTDRGGTAVKRYVYRCWNGSGSRPCTLGASARRRSLNDCNAHCLLWTVTRTATSLGMARASMTETWPAGHPATACPPLRTRLLVDEQLRAVAPAGRAIVGRHPDRPARHLTQVEQPAAGALSAQRVAFVRFGRGRECRGGFRSCLHVRRSTRHWHRLTPGGGSR